MPTNVSFCSLEKYVQRELVRGVATIMKRGWVEGGSMRAMFFAMVDDMVKGGPQMVRHPPATPPTPPTLLSLFFIDFSFFSRAQQYLAGALVVAMLHELSGGGRSSDLALTWEFHQAAKLVFEVCGRGSLRSRDSSGLCSTSFRALRQHLFVQLESGL
jgi:hypothetical protein